MKESQRCPKCVLSRISLVNVHLIQFFGDVQHIKGLVLHPFANPVLSELNTTSSLRSHVVWPSNTGVVVVEQNCRRIDIREGVTTSEMLRQRLRKSTSFARTERTRRPRWLDFERDSSKMTSKIAPSEKFLPNLTELRHRIALSLFQNSHYKFPYTWIFLYWFLYVVWLWVFIASSAYLLGP